MAKRPTSQIKPNRKDGQAKTARRRGEGRITIVLGMIAAAVLGAVGAGILFYGTGSQATGGVLGTLTAPTGTVAYYNFPKVSVDLSRTDGYAGVVTVRISAEFADDDPLERIKQVQPRIVDGMQTFLRAKTRSDLTGSRGTDLMRNGFLNVINDAVQPYKANTVLFREIVIQ